MCYKMSDLLPRVRDGAVIPFSDENPRDGPDLLVSKADTVSNDLLDPQKVF